MTTRRVLIGAMGLGAGAALMALSTPVLAENYYVDGTLGSTCAGSYNPDSRTCSGGTSTAYRTISEAASAAQPGDTVHIRAGTYNERLVPPRSGTANAKITYRAHAGEAPALTGTSEPALFLLARTWLVIEGLTVRDVIGWARLEDSSNNTLRNNVFLRATSSGTTGGFKLVRSHYNLIENNSLQDGNDSLVVQEADRNVIQGNTLTKARHSLISVRCGNYNVIRGNTLNNTDQKAMEIYDCEGVSDAPVKLDATRRNLIEGNTFSYTLASSANYYYNGIQFAGQQGIVRGNYFYDNQGGAINFQVYSQEALYNYGNRVYNNTFYNNRCYGISASSSSTSSRYQDNRAKNNLLYLNVGCAGQSAQTSIGNTTAVVLESNALLTTSPGFVNEGANDLRLTSNSPMVDAGAFVTNTVGAGSGSQITVADAGYFFDGYGIAALQGDLIQLEGGSTTARIVAIDYTNNRLTLDQSLSWQDGQGLHLVYGGARPDMGAYETSATRKIPGAPANLRAVSP
jgi:parallel beta-helix repeat protein